MAAVAGEAYASNSAEYCFRHPFPRTPSREQRRTKSLTRFFPQKLFFNFDCRRRCCKFHDGDDDDDDTNESESFALRLQPRVQLQQEVKGAAVGDAVD